MSTFSVVPPGGAGGAEFGPLFNNDRNVLDTAFKKFNMSCNHVAIVDELFDKMNPKLQDIIPYLITKRNTYDKATTRGGLRTTEEYKLKCNETVQKPIINCMIQYFPFFVEHLNPPTFTQGPIMPGKQYIQTIKSYWEEFKKTYKEGTDDLGTAFSNYIKNVAYLDHYQKKLKIAHDAHMKKMEEAQAVVAAIDKTVKLIENLQRDKAPPRPA